MLKIHQFPHPPLQNYGVLIHDPETGETAAVDAGHGDSYLAAVAATGWTPTQIWVTHHHDDHVDGLAALKAASGATVYGPAGIDGVDTVLAGGQSFTFAGRQVDVIHTPGHTMDMLNFHLASDALVFTGDTLFVMGCGRMFEGTAEDMFASMQKLAALPPETQVYCSHEYTLANAKFAVVAEPENMAIKNRMIEVEQLADQGDPTVPSTIRAELETNPFLRAPDAASFGKLRRDKDNF